jgi:hypothetical protein
MRKLFLRYKEKTIYWTKLSEILKSDTIKWKYYFRHFKVFFHNSAEVSRWINVIFLLTSEFFSQIIRLSLFGWSPKAKINFQCLILYL